MGSRAADGAFADAERVVARREDGDEVKLIVLSVLNVDGLDFALVSPEDSLGDIGCLYVFNYSTDLDGVALLTAVVDDEIYGDAFHAFSDLFADEAE